MSHRLTIKLTHLTELTLALSGKNTNLGGEIDYKTVLKMFPVCLSNGVQQGSTASLQTIKTSEEQLERRYSSTKYIIKKTKNNIKSHTFVTTSGFIHLLVTGTFSVLISVLCLCLGFQ